MTAQTPTPARDLLAPSTEFKKEAFRSVLAISAFIFVYLVLFVCALALVGVSFYGGIQVIIARPGLFTLLIGAGIIACGLLVFFFLIKFLFATTKTDDSESREIFESDHPELFQSIKNLSEKIGTKMPKKVFVSTDVNASVSYNSSFWSMFLPVRKNLKIGLGLVNGLNVSELEAVIAHEFGHFSQRSMKVGSWVYQMNKIVHDMLFNNTSFSSGVDKLSNLHWILNIGALVAVKIIQGIQWILVQMYKLINKSYMGLSRQMEFHADLVSSSVCGSNNLIHALQRSEIAEASYQTTINFCNKIWEDKLMPKEFYAGQRFMLTHFSRKHKYELVNDLPVINKTDDNSVNRVNYKDQWSSHPTTEERKEFLEPFGLDAPVNHTSAWDLFRDADKLRNEMTKIIYNKVPENEVKEVLNENDFKIRIEKELTNASFPSVFKDYYDSREIELFDVDAVLAQPISPNTNFEDVFDEDTAAMPGKMRVIEQNIEVLQAIGNKQIATRSFDYEGKKYKTSEAHSLSARLEGELKELQENIRQSDQNLFKYFYSTAAPELAEALKAAYIKHFETRTAMKSFADIINKMMNPLDPIYRGETLSNEHIKAKIENLKSFHEPAFKKELVNWSHCYQSNAGLKELVSKFLAADYQYFDGESYFEIELNELSAIVSGCWELISISHFEEYRAITILQSRLIGVKEQV